MENLLKKRFKNEQIVNVCRFLIRDINILLIGKKFKENDKKNLKIAL